MLLTNYVYKCIRSKWTISLYRYVDRSNKQNNIPVWNLEQFLDILSWKKIMKLTIQAFLMLINQLQSTNPTCSMMVPFVVQMVLITIVITFPCLKVVCLETHLSPLVQNAHLKIKWSLSCRFAITQEQ